MRAFNFQDGVTNMQMSGVQNELPSDAVMLDSAFPGPILQMPLDPVDIQDIMYMPMDFDIATAMDCSFESDFLVPLAEPFDCTNSNFLTIPQMQPHGDDSESKYFYFIIQPSTLESFS